MVPTPARVSNAPPTFQIVIPSLRNRTPTVIPTAGFSREKGTTWLTGCRCNSQYHSSQEYHRSYNKGDFNLVLFKSHSPE
jgi:hypothetical protein